MSWIHSILQSVAALMISHMVPSAQDGIWQGATEWKREGETLVYSAESTEILRQCEKNPEKELVTPILAQGGHRIFLDDKLILSTADKTFKVTTNFHNTATLACSELVGGRKLRWEAYTQTESLAKLKRFPQLENDNFLGPFFRETANIMIPGTLIGLGILCLFIFYGKVEGRILSSMLLLCFFFATAFALLVPGAFQIKMQQIYIQSISDTCLWLGMIFVGRLFQSLGYTTNRLSRIMNIFCVIGISTILLSGNLDQEQIGSDISFVGIYIFLFGSLLNRKLFLRSDKHRGKNEILKAASVIIFILTALNDLLLFQVPMDSLPLVPFGIFCCTALLALAVNDRVVEAYEERDYLRANLEKEVERKTEALKLAQADLVQSAKLAALGTLSAGIAHEINNALNYVNGSIEPINNILKKEQISDIDRGKASKLLKLMKEGLDLTFGIIVNLKRHTSTTPGQFESLSVQEVVDGTLLLLKNKLSGITIEVSIEKNLHVFGSRVSLSQVLMNLLTNAIDAIEDSSIKDVNLGRKIRISAVSSEGGASISISDSGAGISKEIQERIFDPFFTTKSVGKGTGLGLHIVLSEVKKQGGRVELKSALGAGATFIITFPKTAEGMAA